MSWWRERKEWLTTHGGEQSQRKYQQQGFKHGIISIIVLFKIMYTSVCLVIKGLFFIMGKIANILRHFNYNSNQECEIEYKEFLTKLFSAKLLFIFYSICVVNENKQFILITVSFL